MNLIFVHGWSVHDTSTYGQLPARLEQALRAAGVRPEIHHIWLGKYVSFDDDVTVDDIARAFHQALKETLLDPSTGKLRRFAAVTHSTGGPILRHWIDSHYGPARLAACPLSHLVMLAPANHGSALAQLGKGRLSRLRHLFSDSEPGTQVLDWLELGSPQAWRLNQRWLDYDCAAAGLWLFTLTGQKIDRKAYDHVNAYTGEPGSDGVVRVAAANPNYARLELRQSGSALELAAVRRSAPSAFGVLPGLSHCGPDLGIMTSVATQPDHPTVDWVTRCLLVDSPGAYAALAGELEALTRHVQQSESVEHVTRLFQTVRYETSRYSMLIFRLANDRGDLLSDYELRLTAGPAYSPDELPLGFFLDRQRNRRAQSTLTYFIDHDLMRRTCATPLEGRVGFQVLARPSRGALAFYEHAEFRGGAGSVAEIMRPNETVMIDVTLRRLVDRKVFRLASPGPVEAWDRRPSGRTLEEEDLAA